MHLPVFSKNRRLTSRGSVKLEFRYPVISYDKCKVAAERSKTALVRSIDLFSVVQYLSNNADESYAAACRRAILESVGIVLFPASPIPTSEAQEMECLSSNQGG
jgi:hypothetical protein